MIGKGTQLRIARETAEAMSRANLYRKTPNGKPSRQVRRDL